MRSCYFLAAVSVFIFIRQFSKKVS